MGRHSLDKLAAQELLVAVKGGLAHLSRMRMDAVELGTTDPKALLPMYTRIRKLRDFLERCVEAPRATVMVDLEDEDSNLLSSCLLYELGELDRRVGGSPTKPGSDVDRRLKLLTKFVLRFATKPVDELPRRPGPMRNRVRDAITLVRKSLDPKGTETSRFIFHRGPQSTPAEPAGEAPPPAPPAQQPQPAQQAPAQQRPAQRRPRQASTQAPRKAAARPSPREEQPGHRPGPGDPAARTPQGAQAAPAAEGAGAAAGWPAVPIEMVDASGERGPIIDPHRVRDPRLRSMMTLDLRAYDRATGAQDFRLASVHLASMLEGAVLDYALPRAHELGLQGAPDTWSINTMLSTIITDFSSRDRATLSHLMGTMNMIRPATQLREPVVVTRNILEEMKTLVRRVLTTLGFRGRVPLRAD